MKGYLDALKDLWSLKFIKSSFIEFIWDSKGFLESLKDWTQSLLILLFRLFAFITAPLFLVVTVLILSFLDKRDDRMLTEKRHNLVKSYTKNAKVNPRKEGWDD